MPEYGESLVRAASQKGCQFILSKLNITTQNANALAILGYAAAAIMCEKLTIASQVKIESETQWGDGMLMDAVRL